MPDVDKKVENVGFLEINDLIFKSNKVMTGITSKIKIEIEKFVDKETATVGDILTYLFVITNTGNDPQNNIMFVDEFDTTQLEYVANTFKVNGVTAVPETTSPLTYLIASLQPNVSIQIEFQVKIIENV
jgi:uncharacterized repeat protein (TIGR01451 family)